MNKFRILVVLLLSSPFTGMGQTNNTDSLFAEAKKEAFDHKDYTTALQYAHTILAVVPDYADVLTFAGRLYAWEKNADSARYYFRRALKANPADAEGYAAYADLEYWNNNPSGAVAILNEGLAAAGHSAALQERKARVLIKMRNYDSAFAVINDILAEDPKNGTARSLAAQIRDYSSRNDIGIKYDYIYFDKQFPDPWHLLSLDYTRKTNVGSLTARINYGNRYGKGGTQYELEAYPHFSRTFYGYLNIGYSDGDIVFPRWRAGASLYINLPASFETEIGLRYLYFTSDVFIYTLYLGKYYKNFLAGARMYYTPDANGATQSYSVLLRYYYRGIEDYIGLEAARGLSPDDRRTIVQLDNSYKLQTYRAELTFRYSIRKLNIIRLNCSLLNQEYRKGEAGNQIQAGIGYIRRF